MSTSQRINTFVAGYLRKYHSPKLIPQDLVTLIIALYFDYKDFWNVKKTSKSFNFYTDTIINGPRFQCRRDQLYVSNPHLAPKYTYYNAFGSIVIGQGDDSKTWKLKLMNSFSQSRYRHFYIGIIAMSDKEYVGQPFVELPNGFGIDLFDGTKYTKSSRRPTWGIKYAQRCGEGTVISMTLDIGLMRGKLSYKINDKDFGVAFDDINTYKMYCLAVSMCTYDKIELIE